MFDLEDIKLTEDTNLVESRDEHGRTVSSVSKTEFYFSCGPLITQRTITVKHNNDISDSAAQARAHFVKFLETVVVNIQHNKYIIDQVKLFRNSQGISGTVLVRFYQDDNFIVKVPVNNMTNTQIAKTMACEFLETILSAAVECLRRM